MGFNFGGGGCGCGEGGGSGLFANPASLLLLSGCLGDIDLCDLLLFVALTGGKKKDCGC
ncbi:MAG: hypothetical protein LBN25_03540 [Christensenellaceae bacterium]|jgi:hypothetical protein|nr:hypothetical protein [Christensenellaceae bacterium]